MDVGTCIALDEAGRDNTEVGAELEEAVIVVEPGGDLGLAAHRLDPRRGCRCHYCG